MPCKRGAAATARDGWQSVFSVLRVCSISECERPFQGELRFLIQLLDDAWGFAAWARICVPDYFGDACFLILWRDLAEPDRQVKIFFTLGAVT
jgi:hypothetical protein